MATKICHQLTVPLVHVNRDREIHTVNRAVFFCLIGYDEWVLASFLNVDEFVILI